MSLILSQGELIFGLILILRCQRLTGLVSTYTAIKMCKKIKLQAKCVKLCEICKCLDKEVETVKTIAQSNDGIKENKLGISTKQSKKDSIWGWKIVNCHNKLFKI